MHCLEGILKKYKETEKQARKEKIFMKHKKITKKRWKVNGCLKGL